MSNLVDFPRPDCLATEIEVDQRHAAAFRDLENNICNCLSMAKIAAEMAIDRDDGTDRELIFAIDHLREMLSALKVGYYAAYKNQGQSTAS